MGATAARLLIARLGGEPLPDVPTVIPTELIVRASSPAAADDGALPGPAEPAESVPITD
jgi:hypothetical protein